MIGDDLEVQGETFFGGAANYITTTVAGLMSLEGTAGIVLPHLMQSDSTDQAIADVNDEQVITFDTDVHHAGITRTSASRFTILKESSYLLSFSAVCVGASGRYIALWMKKNGTNVPASSTYYQFKSTGNRAIMTVTFIYHFEVNDYFEFWMWGDSLSNTLDAIAAVALNEGVTPAIPACPSIIMTCNYVGKD